MMLVVDASVALRWYVSGRASEAALSLLEGDAVLIAPDLVVAEVCNAAWKLVCAGEISAEHGSRIAAAITASFSSLIASGQLATRAFAMAGELDHPVYDCLYLALAERESTRVVTADERLMRKLQRTKWRQLTQPL